jgi:hypothetical protein
MIKEIFAEVRRQPEREAVSETGEHIHRLIPKD